MIVCWMGKEDQNALTEYASQVKDGLIVEIGAFTGVSTKTLALASPTSKVVTIDPFVDPEYIGQDTIDEFIKNTKGLDVELVVTTSDKAYDWWNKQIDFLHIDGAHDYEQVKRDIRWLKFVKKGHYVFFHDYTAATLPGVKQAVDETGYTIKTVSGFAVIQV
jgi:predicted O-methyltransferase YrrM